MKPDLCPVCRGNGLVPNGFYTQTSGTWFSTSTTPETCRGCSGRGYVYTPDLTPSLIPTETSGDER